MHVNFSEASLKMKIVNWSSEGNPYNLTISIQMWDKLRFQLQSETKV